MTNDKIALRALLEKGSDATFLHEMIGFAAEGFARPRVEVQRHRLKGICAAGAFPALPRLPKPSDGY